jgi:hypothetical protein
VDMVLLERDGANDRHHRIGSAGVAAGAVLGSATRVGGGGSVQ